jgi:hypothetical protein
VGDIANMAVFSLFALFFLGNGVPASFHKKKHLTPDVELVPQSGATTQTGNGARHLIAAHLLSYRQSASNLYLYLHRRSVYPPPEPMPHGDRTDIQLETFYPGPPRTHVVFVSFLRRMHASIF